MRKLEKIVNALDTTPRHKQMLMRELDAVSTHLKASKDPPWDLIYALFRLSMRLLGFDYLRGARCHSPFYYQTPAQYDTANILNGGDVMQLHHDLRNAVSIRRSIVDDLKRKGMDDFKISLVLNTTEYEVKQLRSNSTPHADAREAPRQPKRSRARAGGRGR